MEELRHALAKLSERLETTVLEINEQVRGRSRRADQPVAVQGKEIDQLRGAIAGKGPPLKLAQTRLNMRTQRVARCSHNCFIKNSHNTK